MCGVGVQHSPSCGPCRYVSTTAGPALGGAAGGAGAGGCLPVSYTTHTPCHCVTVSPNSQSADDSFTSDEDVDDLLGVHRTARVYNILVF